MHVFIESNTADGSKPFLSMQHYERLLESGTLEHLQPSPIRAVPVPIQPQSQQWKKKAIMMIQKKIRQDYGVTVGNLVDKW